MPAKKVSIPPTAEDLTISILGSLDSEFHTSSDRSFAILAASYMDSILENLLRSAFVDDIKATEALLGTSGPIGSNGARYNLAYSLGLINKDERDDLKTIANIRNHFAHNYTATNFDTDDKVRDLVRDMHFAKERGELRKQIAGKDQAAIAAASIAAAKTSSRSLFHDAVLRFLVLLLPRIRDVRRANATIWYPASSKD